MFNQSYCHKLITLLICGLLLTAQATAEIRDPESFFFDESFGMFDEELEKAKEEGKKGVLIMFQQEECPYWHRMRMTVLNQKKVQDYYRQNFLIFQVDIEGDLEITDFKGEQMVEKDFAFRKNRVRATPVFAFFDLNGDRVARYTGATTDVEEFMLLGRYVVDRKYRTMSFNRLLLADLKYAWDNEAMAMRYVQYDRVRERHAPQQVSDVELLQSENSYQVARTVRSASETGQRTSRALLAVAINRPGELSDNLAQPVLTTATRRLPELDELVAAAVRDNLELQAGRNRETAARQQLDASRKRMRPTLDATFQFSEYSRLTPNRDDARARLNLVIPLNEYGSQRAEVAEHKAEWLQASSAVIQLEASLRTRVADLWQQLNRLQIQQQELDVAQKRMQLELDRARGEYELEMRTHLGNAMVNTSRISYQRAKNTYEQALAWMQLYLLIGENPEAIVTSKGV